MKLQFQLYILVAAILLSFGSGFGVRAYIASKDKLATQVSTLQGQLSASRDYEAKIDARDKTNQQLNTDLRQLQLASSKVLNDQLTENARLAADLGVARGMSLRGTTCVSPAASGSAAGSSMADGTGAVLSPETRLLVFDLRAALARAQSKIDGLQDHVAYLEHQIWEHQQLHLAAAAKK